MSRDFPATVDPWVMVRSRRGFSGSWPLARLTRLGELLVRAPGEVAFALQFDVDETGMPFVTVTVRAELWLRCQRTLEPFRYRVDQSSRLGIIASERDEAALPADYEPLLVRDDAVTLVELVEDELILAVPLVPRSGATPRDYVTDTEAAAEESAAEDGPFAALVALKTDRPGH